MDSVVLTADIRSLMLMSSFIRVCFALLSCGKHGTSRKFLTYKRFTKRFHCVLLRRFSYFVIMNTTLEALTSCVNLPITVDLCTVSYLYITSRLWNNLLDCVRRDSSLNLFEAKLSNLNMTSGVKCYCNFCTQFG